MKEVKEYLQKKLKKDDTIVIGVSGGPDSMCLFSLLLELKEKLNLKIVIAHINHNVRIESEEEAEFVSRYATKNNCRFEYLKIDSYEQTNFESEARNKRYNFYKKIILKYQANYLMTAHHGDDLIETILMRLVRGSNINGYVGFRKERKYNSYELLRPLIHTAKEEIVKYNKENNIPYRLDKTNTDLKYTRNRYRALLLPLLKEENKNVHRKFLKFSEELQRVENYLEKETENALTKVFKFGKVNLHEFNELDYVLKKRVLEYILKEEYKNDINDINEKHLKSILDICKSKKANLSIHLPKQRKIIKSYHKLYFERAKEREYEKQILEESVILNHKEKIIKIATCDKDKSNFILRLNSQEISFPLYIRYRKDGDKMKLKNLEGHKKIKDIFINEKIPLEKRDSWPLIVDSNDQILWIPGVKKSNFDKNIDEFYDIIYKYVLSEEK